MFKNVFVIFCAALIFCSFSESVVYLRNVNERGPSAVRAGAKCIQKLVNVYFHNTDSSQISNLVIYIANNMSSPAQEIAGTYLQELHQLLFDSNRKAFQLRIISNAGNMKNLINVPLVHVTLTDYYVLVIDSYETFQCAIKLMRLAPAFNPNAKYIILFNNPSIRVGAEFIVLQILQRLFLVYDSVNVVFAFATSMATYELYTSDPFHGENDCGKMKALKIGFYENGVFRSPKLTESLIRAPKVPNTMESCTFNLCARISSPFVDENCNDGLEMTIINIMKDIMQFKLNKSCEVTERGEPTEDGEWTHLLGKIRSDECHVIIGAFFPDHEVHADFGVSNLYFEDYYTWVVAQAPLQDNWKGLFYIFEMNTWTVFGLVLIVSAVFWFVCGYFSMENMYHKQFGLCFLNTWAVYLCISANNRPNYVSLRIFFVILSLYGLSVTTIYGSKLVSIFTHPPFDYQIDLVEEILNSGLPIGGRLEYEDWFMNDGEQDAEVLSRYNDSEEFQPTPENLHAIINGKRVILLSRMFVKSDPHGEFVHTLTQNVFSNQLEMIVERGFPLLPKFNKVINYMTDMGLIDKVYEDFIFNITIIRNMRDMLEIDTDLDDLSLYDDDDIVLTTDHLQGAFTIYLFGICVSFLVFLGELLVHKLQSGKQAKKQARKQQAKFQKQQRFRVERK